VSGLKTWTCKNVTLLSCLKLCHFCDTFRHCFDAVGWVTCCTCCSRWRNVSSETRLARSGTKRVIHTAGFFCGPDLLPVTQPTLLNYCPHPVSWSLFLHLPSDFSRKGHCAGCIWLLYHISYVVSVSTTLWPPLQQKTKVAWSHRAQSYCVTWHRLVCGSRRVWTTAFIESIDVWMLVGYSDKWWPWWARKNYEDIYIWEASVDNISGAQSSFRLSPQQTGDRWSRWIMLMYSVAL